MPGKEKILEVKNLSVRFRHEGVWVNAVNQLSFEIYRGQTLGLVGESGSGKSVTSLVLMGLFEDRTNIEISGEAYLYCCDKTYDLLHSEAGVIRSLRGNRMAMIFQEPMTALNPVKKCGKQVREAILAHQNVSKKEAKRQTLELFGKVELPDPGRIYSKYPHQLSGGQKQRVMIAMAMSCAPLLLIADEPTTALDVTVQKTILNLLSDLQKQSEMGMLFITHDLGIITEIADRVLVLYKGDKVEEGTLEDVFNHPESAYTKGLLACRPSIDRFDAKLPTVEDFLEGREMDFGERKPMIFKDTDRKKVRVKGIDTWYPASKNIFGKTTSYFKALKNINIDVFKGETLGLVGESGCGKTTLGRTILRLVDPVDGKILYDGVDITAKKGRQLKPWRKKMQIVFQDPHSSLNPRMRIGKALEEVLLVQKNARSAAEARKKALELLRKVNIGKDFYKRYPHELSGGQKQRVCIARALAVEPEFIVCDESVSALDVSVQAQVLNLLNDLKEEYGFTYVFISHDLSVVRHMSDRIVVMKDGEIIETGNPVKIFENPETDYTRKLIESIPGN